MFVSTYPFGVFGALYQCLHSLSTSQLPDKFCRFSYLSINDIRDLIWRHCVICYAHTVPVLGWLLRRPCSPREVRGGMEYIERVLGHAGVVGMEEEEHIVATRNGGRWRRCRWFMSHLIPPQSWVLTNRPLMLGQLYLIFIKIDPHLIKINWIFSATNHGTTLSGDIYCGPEGITLPMDW